MVTTAQWNVVGILVIQDVSVLMMDIGRLAASLTNAQWGATMALDPDIAGLPVGSLLGSGDLISVVVDGPARTGMKHALPALHVLTKRSELDATVQAVYCRC